MDDRALQSIKQHLQNKDAQNRILKNIERGRAEATVTIGRAAELFGFTENQLRDWEARGLICPKKSQGGQRLYPLTELDRLAIIRELLDTKFSPGDIPGDIDRIWYALKPTDGRLLPTPTLETVGQLPIDKRVDKNDHEVFWRFFISQVLRLSLLMILEDMPNTITGLILPLQQSERVYIDDPNDLPRLGQSLVGWLTRNRAFQAFLDDAPSFEFPSDFRIEHLRLESATTYPFTLYIVVHRKARPLVISPVVTETIYHLVQLVYSQVEHWKPCFDYGMHDYVYQASDFSYSPDVTDSVMNGIVNIIIELGGKASDGNNRWHFCNLFLPQDDSLPRQQQNLSVRAHSKDSPVRTSSMVVSISNPGLTFRAYQSGHVIYRSSISQPDHILAYRDTEDETRSAVAIPIGSETGLSIATLYIASKQEHAFTRADLRTLRVIARMIEELLPTYRVGQMLTGKLSDLLSFPEHVDLLFRGFMSEDDFINNLEEFLATIQSRNDIEPQSRPDDPDLWLKTNRAVSFIAIDIDNQGKLATKYGDQVARNLSWSVGSRIQGQLRLQSNPDYRNLYHINADRYYLKLVGMPLDEARDLAWKLQQHLTGEYHFDARRVVMGRPLSPENLLGLSDVTVRLGVSSYPYSKIKEMLQRDQSEIAVVECRAHIMPNLEESLRRGQVEGGDCIISWDHKTWGYGIWSPLESNATEQGR